MLRGSIVNTRGGSMKKILITLVILVVVIIGAGAAYVYLNKDALVQKSIEKGFASVETMVLQNLPATVTEDSVKTIFTETLAKVKSGEIAPEKLQGVFMSFRESWSDKQLDSLEVKDLVGKLQNVLDKVKAENL